MFFLLGILLIAAALAALAIALQKPEETSGIGRSLAALEQMTASPSALTTEVEKPFAERVLEPLQERALALGRRITGADTAERFHRKLELAGNPAGWTVDRVITLKVIGAGVGFAVGLFLFMTLDKGTGFRLVVLAGATLVGFFGPNFFLYQKAYDRQERIQKELADAVDLLTISVESGLGFDQALQQVASNTEGPLAEEFSRMLREMQIGQGRPVALRNLAERSNAPELRSLVSALVQADAFGISVSAVLRVQSAEMRVKRRQKAEEKAQQVPVKMTVPLIFCILPCLFISVLGPAAISMMGGF